MLFLSELPLQWCEINEFFTEEVVHALYLFVRVPQTMKDSCLQSKTVSDFPVTDRPGEVGPASHK